MNFGFSRGGTLGLVVIVLLALVWALLLLPSAIRSKIASSPINAVARFEQTMGILESTRRPKPAASGRWIMVPRQVNNSSRRRNRVIRRRRQNFVRMLALAVATLAVSFFPRLHVLLWVHLAVDATVALYVWRLLVYKQRERQAAVVVTELPAGDQGMVAVSGIAAESPRRAAAK